MNLFERIDNNLSKGLRANVVISGMTCSGKTTLAKSIYKRYKTNPYKELVSIIPQDEYFKDLNQIPRSRFGYLMDSIDAFFVHEYLHDVLFLLQFDAVRIPQYDIANNRRTSQTKHIWNNDINIFEGLHALQILKSIPGTIKVFVDTDEDTCLQRRIDRDTSKYGVPKERIMEYWNECIIPLSEKYILPQKALADIIISGKGGDGNDS